MSNVYQPEPAEIAGFDLYGRRLPNGKIELNTGKILDDFPKEVLVIDMVYELEYIKKNVNEKNEVINNIEWGIYV